VAVIEVMALSLLGYIYSDTLWVESRWRACANTARNLRRALFHLN